MNRMMSLAVALAFVGLSLLSGCATIVNGRTQKIAIASNPPGAIATVDTGEMCVTPGTVTLARNKDYLVTITKEGYQPQVVSMNSVLSGWLLGNILLGGIIGGGIDAATGAGWTITPEKLNVTMFPLAPGQAPAPLPSAGALTIDDRLRIVEDMRANGTMTEVEYAAVKKRLTEEKAAMDKKTATPTAAPSHEQS